MDIVDQIRADRENGAICLEREYKSRLMAVAVKLCRDETEAEALVYQAFDEAVRRIETLSHPESFYSWLCSILVNCHGMATRRKENSRVSFTDKLPEPPEEDGMDNIVRTVDGAILHEAIDRLPPKLKETVVLRYFMDMPLQQIARFLMIPVGTVNSRLHVARMALSMRLGAKLKNPAVALVAAGLFLLSSAAVIGLRYAGALGGADEPVQESASQGAVENVLEGPPDASAAAPAPSDEDANLALPQQENTEMKNTAMKTATIGGLFRKAMRGISMIAMTALAANATYGDDPYIESDGTSGISTGYRMKGTSRVEVDFALTAQTEQARIFGDDSVQETGLKTVLYVSGGATHFAMTVGSAANGSVTRYKEGTDTLRHTSIIDLPANKAHLVTGGVTNLNANGVDGGFSGAEANMPLPLFGRWGNAQATKFANMAKARIYGVKIYESDVLVRDFVPCLKDGAACFKDLVNGGFIIGENASAFSAGGDVPTFADDGYVSTAANADGGKLYFDTGYKTTDKSAVAIDCALTVNRNLGSSIWRLFQEGSGNIFDFNLNGNNGLRYQVAGTYKNDFTTAFKETLYDDKDVRRTFFLDNRGQAAVITSGYTNQLVSFTQASSVSHSYSLRLASNWAGNSDFAAIKIYGCKIWENGALVRDFAPYVNNGTPGLRDNITGAFAAASRGSGDSTSALAYGGAIVEDAYLQSAGSANISTDYKMNGSSRLEVDFSLISTAVQQRIFGTDVGETFKTYMYIQGDSNYSIATPWGQIYPSHKADTIRHTAIIDVNHGWAGLVTGCTTNWSKTTETAYVGREADSALPLFGRGSAYATERIYSVRIYESDALAHEFIPYSRGGVVGLYDTVTGEVKSNGPSFTFGGAGQDFGQLKVYIKPGYNDRIGYAESTALTAYAPGATSYRWLCDGTPVEGGADGVLSVAWTRGGVAQAPGFKVHTYQAVAVFENLYGATRESAASAAADIKCRQLGTTFIIK